MNFIQPRDEFQFAVPSAHQPNVSANIGIQISTSCALKSPLPHLHKSQPDGSNLEIVAECLSFSSSKESGQVLVSLWSSPVFWQTVYTSSPTNPDDLSLHLRITFHRVSAKIFCCPPSFLLTSPWWSINFTSSWPPRWNWLSQCSRQLVSSSPAGYIFQKHSSFLSQTLNHSAFLFMVFFKKTAASKFSFFSFAFWSWQIIPLWLRFCQDLNLQHLNSLWCSCVSIIAAH